MNLDMISCVRRLIHFALLMTFMIMNIQYKYKILGCTR